MKTVTPVCMNDQAILSGGIWRCEENLQGQKNDSLGGVIRKKDGHGNLIIRLGSGGEEGGPGFPSGFLFMWLFHLP